MRKETMTAPDALIRAEALDPSRSFIVQAPAGSGKTELLMQRYLRLLATVERPESVVAMTFTRKAAQEMKERILQALIAATPEQGGEGDGGTTRRLAADVLRHDQRLGWHLLADPSRLHIETIDALCARLAREMPVLSQFGGVAAVVEHAEDLYLTAAREALHAAAIGGDEQTRDFPYGCGPFRQQSADAGRPDCADAQPPRPVAECHRKSRHHD